MSWALAPTSMSMLKSSPPVMPPAVLTITASSVSWLRPFGKRTRSEPASCTRVRLLPPGVAATLNETRPTARLAAKTSPRNGALPGIKPVAHLALDRHCPLQCVLVEIVPIAGIDDGAPIHDGEMVAEFTGKVEILLDQHDGDFAERAQVGDGAADILDDRGLA